MQTFLSLLNSQAVSARLRLFNKPMACQAPASKLPAIILYLQHLPGTSPGELKGQNVEEERTTRPQAPADSTEGPASRRTLGKASREWGENIGLVAQENPF